VITEPLHRGEHDDGLEGIVRTSLIAVTVTDGRFSNFRNVVVVDGTSARIKQLFCWAVELGAVLEIILLSAVLL
jgi:hypothetical protein